MMFAAVERLIVHGQRHELIQGVNLGGPDAAGSRLVGIGERRYWRQTQANVMNLLQRARASTVVNSRTTEHGQSGNDAHPFPNLRPFSDSLVLHNQ